MDVGEVRVSIVTPTFPGREQLLLERCMPSIQAQTWPGPVEHVVLSDRNPQLRETIRNLRNPDIVFAEINETWRNPITEASIGAVPWCLGSMLAMGEFVGFVGDDDEILPDHIAEHVNAMREQQATFSVSQIDFRANGESKQIIGDDSFAHGHVDATGVMCHISALGVANWNANGENAADWRLVRDWIAADLHGVYIPKITGIHNDGWLVNATGRPDRPQ